MNIKNLLVTAVVALGVVYAANNIDAVKKIVAPQPAAG